MRKLAWAVLAAGVWTGAAHAQRVADNAVKAADDAFGTTVGNEQVGLYNPYEARGFSPVEAGNVRIEGLYFDQQTQLNSHVGRGNSVRVGISAQSYAFPAPTGVADFNLRLPGDKSIVSAMVGGGQYDTVVLEVDAQTPLTTKLSVGAGAGFIRIDNQDASKNVQWSYGTTFRLQPGDTSEVSGFWSELDDCHNEQQVRILPGGAWEPPRVKRRTFFGQGWSSGHCRQTNGGVLARHNFGDDWRLRAGLFRSSNVQHKTYGDFMRDVRPDGTGQHYLFKAPRSEFVSISGEIRLTKVLTTGAFRHTLDLSLRGRDVDRLFGGGDTKHVGPGRLGEQIAIPEPAWNFGAQTENETKQAAFGISYFGQWAGVGGMTLGVSKMNYRRDTRAPAQPVVRADDKPWLYNIGVNAFATDALAVYAGYTRGLEETGNAPDIAANTGEPMPAAITQQLDAGLRYALLQGVNVIAGVFEVKKPYFNLDRANVWGPFGEVRHRGIEASLAGRPFEGLNVVAGIMLLQARVRGDAVDRGLIGDIPVGQFPRSSFISLQYQPEAWNGFGVDLSFYEAGGQRTTPDNALKTDGYRHLNAGLRYYFKIGDSPASFRFNVHNITNAYDWYVGGGGGWFPRGGRRYTVNLAADF